MEMLFSELQQRRKFMPYLTFNKKNCESVRFTLLVNFKFLGQLTLLQQSAKDHFPDLGP